MSVPYYCDLLIMLNPRIAKEWRDRGLIYLQLNAIHVRLKIRKCM